MWVFKKIKELLNRCCRPCRETCADNTTVVKARAVVFQTFSPPNVSVIAGSYRGLTALMDQRVSVNARDADDITDNAEPLKLSGTKYYSAQCCTWDENNNNDCCSNPATSPSCCGCPDSKSMSDEKVVRVLAAPLTTARNCFLVAPIELPLACCYAFSATDSYGKTAFGAVKYGVQHLTAPYQVYERSAQTSKNYGKLSAASSLTLITAATYSLSYGVGRLLIRFNDPETTAHNSATMLMSAFAIPILLVVNGIALRVGYACREYINKNAIDNGYNCPEGFSVVYDGTENPQPTTAAAVHHQVPLNGADLKVEGLNRGSVTGVTGPAGPRREAGDYKSTLERQATRANLVATATAQPQPTPTDDDSDDDIDPAAFVRNIVSPPPNLPPIPRTGNLVTAARGTNTNDGASGAAGGAAAPYRSIITPLPLESIQLAGSVNPANPVVINPVANANPITNSATTFTML